MAIPLLAVLLVVHGRLVFPVYGIRLTPAAAELVVAVFYGGVHAADLLLAIATFVLSLSMWRDVYGVKVASLGFAAGIAEVVASYP